jgi:hypothetical protein
MEEERTLEQVLSSLPEPTSLPNALPLTHLSIARWFSSIVATRSLQPRRCPVFGEDLLYLFYGGVFYRPQSRVTTDATNLPIAFVFHPDCLTDVRRFYPFDTGALHSDRAGPFREKLADFQRRFALTGGDDQALRRLISYVFGSNAGYLSGRINPACREHPAPFPDLHDYLSADLTAHGVDRRQFAIECQLTNALKLGNSLLWVGFPDCYWEIFQDLCRTVGRHRPRFYDYATARINHPAELAATLETQARLSLSEYLETRRREARGG